MSTYKVLAVQGPREWQWNGERNHDYELTLEGESKPAILTQKPTKRDGSPNPPPAGGATLDLELSPHRFEGKLKAKRVQQQTAFAGRSAGTPRDDNAIQRQHSQEMAIRLVDLSTRLGLVKFEGSSELFDTIRSAANWFDDDIRSGAKRAKEKKA